VALCFVSLPRYQPARGRLGGQGREDRREEADSYLGGHLQGRVGFEATASGLSISAWIASLNCLSPERTTG